MEVTCSHFRGEGKGPLAKIAFGATANEGREPLIGLPPHWKSSGRLCLRRRYLLGVGVGDGTVCTGSWESESWFGRSAGRSVGRRSVASSVSLSVERRDVAPLSPLPPSIGAGFAQIGRAFRPPIARLRLNQTRFL